MAATKLEQGQRATGRRLEPPKDLSSRRFGGLVVVEYLMRLFGESPKEVFSRIDILAVLECVKKDRALLPEVIVSMSDRIRTEGRTRRWTGPKRVGSSAVLDQY